MAIALVCVLLVCVVAVVMSGEVCVPLVQDKGRSVCVVAPVNVGGASVWLVVLKTVGALVCVAAVHKEGLVCVAVVLEAKDSVCVAIAVFEGVKVFFRRLIRFLCRRTFKNIFLHRT